jgi:hypothetical protein
MGEVREERLARNEVMFRTVNERIDSIAATFGEGVPYEFVCECASRDCFELILLTLDEYERIREDGTRFLVYPGHQDIEIERVVDVHSGYLVVEKDGVAGLVALAEDPRG